MPDIKLNIPCRSKPSFVLIYCDYIISAIGSGCVHVHAYPGGHHRKVCLDSVLPQEILSHNGFVRVIAEGKIEIGNAGILLTRVSKLVHWTFRKIRLVQGSEHEMVAFQGLLELNSTGKW
jgi:hypothetical protein